MPDSPRDLAETVGAGMQIEASRRQLLLEQGCDSVQGYLISSPLPPAQFAAAFLKAVPSHQSSHPV